MLLFISLAFIVAITGTKVSIHLMLLFIAESGLSSRITQTFQYISCYSLSNAESNRKILINGFQYISCYSLSFPDSPARIAHDSFNTSHVTLYLIRTSRKLTPILRFNTSHVTLYPIDRATAETTDKFQYISCYSLSLIRYKPFTFARVSIHLMLLFIYQSHRAFRTHGVSIHLMLLFIDIT